MINSKMGKFREVQQFGQWWLKLLVWAGAVGMLIRFCIDLRENPNPGLASIISLVVIFMVTLWFQYMSLISEIDEKEIRARFTLMPFGKKVIPWSDVKSWEIRNYNGLLEYGGWGNRYSVRIGRAFTTSGNQGLQLELESGKSFLLGTHEESKLTTFLEQSENIMSIRK